MTFAMEMFSFSFFDILGNNISYIITAGIVCCSHYTIFSLAYAKMFENTLINCLPPTEHLILTVLLAVIDALQAKNSNDPITFKHNFPCRQ